MQYTRRERRVQANNVINRYVNARWVGVLTLLIIRRLLRYNPISLGSRHSYNYYRRDLQY
jgi:hypothetical protein